MCGHYGRYTEDADVGCLLMREKLDRCPGDIAGHLLHGGGCLDDPEQFPPADQTLDAPQRSV